MKKVLLALAVILLLIVIGFQVYVYSLGAPFDEERSPYMNMAPPENLVRTIHNPLAGHYTTFVTKAHETDGAYTLLEFSLAPGGENGPHYHNSFREVFEGVSGRTGVHINGEDFYLEEGETATAEKGDVHYFFNDTDETVTFQVRIEPGSPGFEKSLYILYGLANDGLMDEDGIPDNMHYTAIFAAYSDTRGAGALRVLNPVLDRLAGQAQREGVESDLIERYYLSQVEEEREP